MTCAIVVTHNRRELLAECLAAVFGQTTPPDEVLVIDNASGDGTPEMVRERFPCARLERLAENAGGAGGFHRGLALGHARGHDWLWLMDDDTIPAPDALEALHAGARRAPTPPALVASRVVWTDGRLHPMNRPHPRWRAMGELADGARHGLVALRTGTFVSIMFPRATIDRHGLPLARYFIWSDDVEYTARVLRDGPGYLVPESVAVHKTRTPHTAIEDSSGRFYFHVRNSLLLLRGTSYAPIERWDYGRYLLRSVHGYLARNRWRPTAWGVVARGARDGLTWPVR